MAGVAAPTLFLIAGPNGAGKSTLYHDRIAPITRAPFVNAHVYDNSKAGRAPRFILALTQGDVRTISDGPVPDWAARLYLDG